MNCSRPKSKPVKKRTANAKPFLTRPIPPVQSVQWEQVEPGSIVVKVPYHHSKDWRQTFLLASDRHWDNPKSDQAMQKRHLEEMIDRNAYLIDNGDFFCAMQGKYDKRANKTSVRPEHNTDEYLDALVNTAGNWFAPYADRIIMLGEGNHEAAIRKNHETSLIQRLVGLLNSRSGRVICGGFSGFIKFSFRTYSPSGPANGRDAVLHYDHGYGGGGPVTNDRIQHQRRQVYLPDADIIVSGHTHDQWNAWISRKRLNTHGHIHHDAVLHVKTPTYKEEYGNGQHGWHVERGGPPKPIGAYWLNFFFKAGELRFDVERAV